MRRPKPWYVAALWALAVYWGSGVVVLWLSMARPFGPRALLDPALGWIAQVLRPLIGDMAVIFALICALAVVPFMLALGVFAWLRPGRTDDGFLHCPKCDYILKGLAEPRCPECGERI
jgi:hypothetical protein